ncbi:MAG TPA: type II toxin-antitoxin system VapC family toxin [Desulfatiglandales bacterium]|nr:type II toxin-antitoxin system VapC family toxin [Desulfatiglandales bacterium]
MKVATVIAGLHVLLEFDITIREEPELYSRAMELPHQLKRLATYDCHYLALAEMHNCEIWTGDERFYKAVMDTTQQVKIEECTETCFPRLPRSSGRWYWG